MRQRRRLQPIKSYRRSSRFRYRIRRKFTIDDIITIHSVENRDLILTVLIEVYRFLK